MGVNLDSVCVNVSKQLKFEAMLDYLPEEIRLDILLRLPTKSLIRCTSVSKPWLSIIRNSSFIRSHLSRKINTQHGSRLLLHRCYSKYELNAIERKEMYSVHYDNRDFDECLIDFPLKPMVEPINEYFRVAGICDGLLCLADDLGCKAFNYIIWNPSIRKAVLLPMPNVHFNTVGPFDDSIGFGFDSMANDYKVVRIISIEDLHREGAENPTVAEVYSVATGSWRSLGSVAPPCRIFGTRPYTFLNGVIHWIVECWESGSYFILTFGLGSETFGRIMIPEVTECHYKLRVFGSADGKSLALCMLPLDQRSCDIWIMKEYCQQESWTKLITLGPQGPERSINLKPLFFRKSGEVILARRKDNGMERLVSLDPVSQVSQQLNNLESLEQSWQFPTSIHPYEESLVLLDMDTAASW